VAAFPGQTDVNAATLSTIQTSPKGTMVSPTPGVAPHAAALDMNPTASTTAAWAGASPQQVQQAQQVIAQTQQTASQYKDIRAALAAGYTMAIYQPQTGFLHLVNPALMNDGKVGDPSAPEALVYHVASDGTPTLQAAMFTKLNGQAAPTMGISPDWHQHEFLPGVDMLHVWMPGTPEDPFGNVEPSVSSAPPANPDTTLKLHF
jgi:hypothetical protein